MALRDDELIARYRRAVVERNVRLLELRVLNPEQILSDFKTLKHELQELGFDLSGPITPKPFSSSPWTLAFVWLGLVSLLILTLESLGRLSSLELVLLWLAAISMGLIGLLEFGDLMRQLSASLTAVLVPIAAFVLLKPQGGFVFWLAFSAISILGGLGSAAFLSQDPYFLKIRQFTGVKLAFVLPVLCVGLLTIMRIRLVTFTKGFILSGLGVTLLMVIILIRSGNEPVWPPAGWEEGVRAWLEEVLVVRPRFKEFLLGHPLLLLWGGLGALRWRPWALGLMLAGLIGQISIMNSFMHLHTPLWVTLLRTAHGLWLGAALGWPLMTLLHRALRLSRA